VKGPAGCGGTAIKAGLLEEYVTGAVLDALESPRVQQALRAGEDQDAPRRAELLAQIRDAGERREEARRDYSGRVIDRADWLDIRQRTEDEISAARREYDRLAGSDTVMGDIPASERVRDAWESWSTDRRRAAIRAVLHRVLIKPLPPAPAPTSPATARTRPCAANGNWRSCGSASNSTGACSDHATRAAAETSQAVVSAASGLCRWFARAAGSFVLRRRAGITQERGEHRDRGRVLNSLRETVFGPGAPRIVRAGLPDRGALLVAEGLPRGVTGRARPVRPARRRRPRSRCRPCPRPGSLRRGPAAASRRHVPRSARRPVPPRRCPGCRR
jgi:hypothetical protein